MGAITPYLYAHFHTSLTAGVLSVLSVWQWLSTAVKRQWGRNRDVESLLGSFAESQGNFPHHQLSSAVCQPLLPTVAATVPTTVYIAAYDSKPLSVTLLMTRRSTCSVHNSTDTSARKLCSYIRTTCRQTEMNHGKQRNGSDQKVSLLSVKLGQKTKIMQHTCIHRAQIIYVT